MINRADLTLYLVADPDHVAGDFLSAVSGAIAGGVTIVQLRAKSLTDREHLALASTVQRLCGSKGIPFLVNDRLDIALASRADGIHLGVDDLPVRTVRELTEPQFIIGFSPDSDEQIRSASMGGCDYLGIGPVYGTATKGDAGAALGIPELSRRCGLGQVPVVGIGGIGVENAPEVIRAGADGVAVVSAILRQPDPERAARTIRNQVETTVR